MQVTGGVPGQNQNYIVTVNGSLPQGGPGAKRRRSRQFPEAVNSNGITCIGELGPRHLVVAVNDVLR